MKLIILILFFSCANHFLSASADPQSESLNSGIHNNASGEEAPKRNDVKQGSAEAMQRTVVTTTCTPGISVLSYLYNPIEPLGVFGYCHFGVSDVYKLRIVIDEALVRGEDKVNILNIGSFTWLLSIFPFLNTSYPEIQFSLYGLTQVTATNLDPAWKGCFAADNSTFHSKQGNCDLYFVADFEFSQEKITALPMFHFIISNGTLHNFKKPQEIFSLFYDQLHMKGIFISPGFKFLGDEKKESPLKKLDDNAFSLLIFLCALNGDFIMVDGNYPGYQGELYWTICIRKKTPLTTSMPWMLSFSAFESLQRRDRSCFKYVESEGSSIFSTLIASPLRQEIVDLSFSIIRKSHYLIGLFYNNHKCVEELNPALKEYYHNRLSFLYLSTMMLQFRETNIPTPKLP